MTQLCLQRNSEHIPKQRWFGWASNLSFFRAPKSIFLHKWRLDEEWMGTCYIKASFSVSHLSIPQCACYSVHIFPHRALLVSKTPHPRLPPTSAFCLLDRGISLFPAIRCQGFWGAKPGSLFSVLPTPLSNMLSPIAMALDTVYERMTLTFTCGPDIFSEPSLVSPSPAWYSRRTYMTQIDFSVPSHTCSSLHFSPQQMAP